MAENQDDESVEPRKFLSTGAHCNGCSKLVKKDELALFVILFWSGFDRASGEPIVRDGIFDDSNNIALLRACPSCGPKIVALHKAYTFDKMGQLFNLNDGPLKHMLREIWARRKPDWKFEIGWQIMLPLMQRYKTEKQRKLLEVRKEDEKVEKMKFDARLH